jgi:hypothetical protein
MSATVEERRARGREEQARRRARLRAQGLTAKGTPTTRRRGDAWAEILERAVAIVEFYATRVTLRQLFYRLVADAILRNTVAEYRQLSSRTAEARRAGTFPDLLDRTSEIVRWKVYDSPEQAISEARDNYRRDRTEDQEYQIWLVVEKAGLLAQLESWFSDRGLPMAALSGYVSQTDADSIRRQVEADPRPAILLYGGDFDPSGEDIFRDFTERTDCWDDKIRVALTAEQVATYNLPELPGKSTDSRSSRFVAEHGRLVQVEFDALDPNDLRDLFEAAIDTYWDWSAFASVQQREAAERHSMRAES